MKKFFWILALVVFLSACGNEAKNGQDGAKEAGQVSEDKAKDDGKVSDDKKAKEAEDNSVQASLKEDDFFFSSYDLVTVKDGKLVNVITDVKKLGDDTYAYPVPLSDDVFLFGTTNGENTSTLMKINGKDFEEFTKSRVKDFLQLLWLAIRFTGVSGVMLTLINLAILMPMVT